MNVRQWFRASGCFAVASLSWCAVLLVAASARAQVPSTPVGTASAIQTATVTITAAGTLGNVYVLTQGATSLDFNAVSPAGGTCAAGNSYSVNDTCTVQYTFTPTHPWVRYGSISLMDSSDNLLGNVFLAGLGTGPQVSYPLGAATVPASLGTGFNAPAGIAVDANGNVYIADTGSNSVKQVVAVGGVIPANPTITTLVTGLNAPTSVAIDGAGNVYFSDSGTNAIREILAVGGAIPANPTVLTLGSNFLHPKGVAVDGSGNVYVADTSNDAIKEILAVNGVIPSSNPTIITLGSGFLAPAGVFVDGSGNVFVADTGNSLVKEIVAVSGSIPANNPTINPLGGVFSSPQSVAVDGSGNVYVADLGSSAVREFVAVGGTVPSSGATVIMLGSGLTNPDAVTVDSSGNVFITDRGTNLASELNAQNPPSLSFAATSFGANSSDSPRSFSLMNNGNTSLIFSIPTTGNNPSISANFNLDASSTCPQLTSSSTGTGSLSAGSSCTDAVNFKPTMAGSPLSGSVISTDNNLNASGSTQTISLSGTGNVGTPVVTATATSVAVNTSSVTLAASISYAGVAPTGNVTFAVNSGTAFAATCTGTSSPLSCTASYNPSSLTVAAYPFQVSVASDGNYNSASASGTLTITKGTPALTVSSTGTSTVNGQVTFMVTITPNTGITPTGTVSFSTTLNTATSTITGCSSLALTSGPGSTLTATCQTSALLAGSNAITATIATDTNFNAASSTAITQTVNQATPVLTLAPTSGTSAVNDQVTYTATVTPSSGIVPSGSLMFSTALGAAAASQISGCTSLPIVTSGTPPYTVTCTTSALLAGTNSITAAYAGDANFTGATSNTATQAVTKVTPSLTLSPASGSSMVNGLVTFNVAVSPNSGIVPAGALAFSTVLNGVTNAIVGCTAVAAPGVGSSVTASCPTRSLLAGSNSITAVIASDANFNASTSNAAVQTVNPATTSLAVTSSQPTSSTVDQAVTFTATLSLPNTTNPFTVSPGGTVRFSANSVVINTCSASSVDPSTHAATCTTSGLFAPSDVIVATYSSDANFLASTSPQFTQIVNKNTPVTTVLSDLPTSAVINQTVTFTATITPAPISALGVALGGSVTFTNSGTTLCDRIAVSPNTDGTATATCRTSFSSVFSGAISATYSGDPNFNAGLTGNVNQTVAKGNTTTTVNSATNPSVVNQSVNLTATVTAAITGTATPQSGSLVFTDSADPTNPFCSTVLSAGVLQPATCQHVFASSGNHTVTVAFTSTDANFNSSTAATSLIQVVNQATTTLTVSNTGSGTPTVNQSATFQATFSNLGLAVPQGSVSYLDGATSIASCQNLAISPAGATTPGAVPSCVITFLTAGDHFITAAFTSTDSNFGSVTSAQLRQTVNKNTPSVTVVSNLQSTAVVNQAVTFTATITPNQVLSSSLAPGGNITFTRGQGGPILCQSVTVTSSAGSTATASCLVAFSSVYTTGTSIVASYSGDTNFLAVGGNVNQTVLKGAVTTTVTSATNPSTVNQSVILTASVIATISTGPAAPQSGTVTFADSTDPTNTFCPSNLVAGVIQPATCQHIFPTSGPHVVTATFISSDSNFDNGTTANSLTQMVNAAALTLTVTSSSTPTVNQQATFQSTFSPLGQSLPQGMVSYSDGSTIICQNMAVSVGVAPNCTATFLTAGSHSIKATFTPSDTNFVSTTSAPFLLSVAQNTPTVAITSPASTSTPTVGQDQTFTATVTSSASIGNTAPTGNVSFTYSVVTPTGIRTGTVCTTPTLVASGIVGTASCPLSPLILAGKYTITAQYLGDLNFNIASSGTLTETVGKAVTSLTVGPIPVAQINTPTSFSPSLSITSMIDPAGTGTTQPTGTFTLTDGQGANAPVLCNVQVAAGVISCPAYNFPTAGSHTLYATYTGDDNFSGSTATAAMTAVVTATPVISVTSSSLVSVATQAVTFIATVTASPTGPTVPTNAKGNITFSITQSGITAPFTCSSYTPQITSTTDTATCIVTGFGTSIKGNITVTATYFGDGNYNMVTSAPITQVVQNFTPTVTPTRITLAQGTTAIVNTNLIDPYASVAIQSSIAPLFNFPDATAVSACTFVDSSGNAITVPGLSCAPVAASATTIAGAVVTAASAAVGDYALQLTFTDQARATLSQTATTTVTVLSQPASILSVGVGASSATFTLPASLGSPAASNLACGGVAVYDSVSKKYVSGTTTLARVGLTCSSITASGGTYSFTITSSGATAKLETGSGTFLAAVFGAPFLVLLGFFPRSKGHGKTLPRLLSIVVLIAVSISAVGCGGGFTRTDLAATATNGSYLIQIVNTAQSRITVAEIPVVISGN